MNSNNSSKPPSSDGFRKPNRNQSLRSTGKNKSGGQTGHKGSTLELRSHPDEIIVHDIELCAKCNGDLSKVSGVVSQVRQELDIPTPKIKVTEHQILSKVCPGCHSKVKASFPQGINAPVQYGLGIKAYATYLATEQFIPEDRLQTLFLDLFGLSIATDTLVSFTKKLHYQLEGFNLLCFEAVQKSLLNHLDETSLRVAGKTQWLHVSSNESFTYYHLNVRRKALLEGLQGFVVHDHWKCYYLMSGVKHALCNAHHLRELNARIEDGESWALPLKRLLLLLCKKKKEHKGVVPIETRNWASSLYDKIISKGLAYHEALPSYKPKRARGRQAKHKGHNLLLRLKNFKADTLRFMYEPEVPFTNNQAERDLRMMKVKQKISGGFRTLEGAEVFVRIRSFISTLKKQKLNVFENIKLAIVGQIPTLI